MSNGRFVKSSEHSVVSLLADIRDEIRDFLQTRIQILQSEMREKVAALKPVVPQMIFAAVLLVTAYLLLTLALVAAIGVLLARYPFHWALALVIVGGAWLLVGLIFAGVAFSKLRSQELTPQKTLQILRADKMWIESEAKRPL